MLLDWLAAIGALIVWIIHQIVTSRRLARIVRAIESLRKKDEGDQTS